jgi:hypothetical protein
VAFAENEAVAGGVFGVLRGDVHVVEVEGDHGVDCAEAAAGVSGFGAVEHVDYVLAYFDCEKVEFSDKRLLFFHYCCPAHGSAWKTDGPVSFCSILLFGLRSCLGSGIGSVELFVG